MSQEIESIIHLFSKFPGLGQRSARRMVLHLIKNKQQLLAPLIGALEQFSVNIKICKECGNIDSCNPCSICNMHERKLSNQICVVEDVADLWAIERSHIYKGRYHVLGGTLSAIDGRGPDDLNIEYLITKTGTENIKEVILATNATVDGQTTAYYIAERLKDSNIIISRLAHGIPMGGELDYLDDGTLGAALHARKPF
jgi:recombination protein RecR